MGLRHRKGHKDEGDVESNDTAVDGSTEKSELADSTTLGDNADSLHAAPEFTGDEYEQLLQVCNRLCPVKAQAEAVSDRLGHLPPAVCRL